MERTNQTNQIPLEKIPLEKRLKKARWDTCDSHPFFYLPLDGYFHGWDELLGGSRFMEIYRQVEKEYATLIGEGCTTSIVHTFLNELPTFEGLELATTILVEPFAAWHESVKAKPTENILEQREENENEQ